MPFSESSVERLVFWGCELSADSPAYTLQVPRHGDSQLELYTICLRAAAPDEFHEVEVVAGVGDNRTRKHLATLRLTVLPMVALAGLELPLPATFRLRAGSGPVCISGQLVSLLDQSEDEDEEDEEPPKKPPKGSRVCNGTAKGRGGGRGRRAAAKN